VTTSDPPTVARLRRLVNAMPVSTGGVTSCPADTGQRFELAFQGPGVPSVVVVGLTSECGGIGLDVTGKVPLGMTDSGSRVLAATEALAAVRSGSSLTSRLGSHSVP
jgi:hypothetical protein